MAINKFQVTLISLTNILSAIYSWICLSEYGIIYRSFDSDPSQIWLSVVLMGIAAALTGIYFSLMCLYGIACSCLTGDTSNQRPSFSLCGCISFLMIIVSYLWGWSLYISIGEYAKPILIESYPLIWNAFLVLLYNPVIVVSLSILFNIYKYCCKKSKKNEENHDLIDHDQLYNV